MATPTRSQVVSTPKSHLKTTPNRSNASPRPNTGMIAHKHLAGKSPAVKTPASLHGHAHRVSVSSHPASTPLAATQLADDILNMNSPAAALMSMGTAGLTPIPSTQDGLGIHTGTGGATAQDGSRVRDPQKERYERLKEAAQELLDKSGARGVSRTSVEKSAKIHGFEVLWDENVGTIAGASTDLEILFDRVDTDTVKSATLKINMPDEEGVLQESASKILSKNLTTQPDVAIPWIDTTDFSANLAYLGRLEHIVPAGSAFRAMANLYDTFQSIWMAEKKYRGWRHEAHHLCQSSVGRPTKDAERRLGVSCDYWTAGARFYAKEEPKVEGRTSDFWHAEFSVEQGAPSIPVTQKWLADEPLTSTVTAENIFQDSAMDKPSWQVLVPTTEGKTVADEDTMGVDQSQIAETYDMHFTCSLQPQIFVPVPIANGLNEDHQVIEIRQDQLQSFQQSVGRPGDADATNGTSWKRLHFSYDKTHKPLRRIHAYTVYGADQPVLQPVSKLSFSHPRQFAEALPVLRQYALINVLLKSIVPDDSTAATVKNAPDSIQRSNDQKPLTSRSKITKRSNKPKFNSDISSVFGSPKSSAGSEEPLAIDVELYPLHNATTKSCRLKLRTPLPTISNLLSHDALTRTGAENFMLVEIDVLLNGVVEIASIGGVTLAKGQGRDREREKMEEFQKKLARVVRASEDLGLVVEWVLRELER